jgi:hypothetical protein
MRKFFLAVAVGVLAVAVAAPAMALDFKFGSEYRVRMFAGTNISSAANVFDGDVAGNNPRGAQVRLRPRFDVRDDNGNIQATLRLEIGDVTFGNGGGPSGQTNLPSVGQPTARTGPGQGGGLGNDGVNVETKWAYLDAAFPFGVPARVRAGLQPWYLPKGLIMDDDGAGIRIYGTVKPISYDLAWFRADGDGTNTLDDNYDFYQAKVDAALAPIINPGVYYVYGRNATARAEATGWQSGDAQLHFIGATVTGKLGIVAYDLDFVYGSASGGTPGTFGETTRGWALDGAVHFPLGPVTINLAGTYATGDEQDGGKFEAFPSIAASWNGPGGGFEMIGSGGVFDAIEYTQDGPTNLWVLGAWVTYNPVKALTLKAGYAYAGFVETPCTSAQVTAGTCYGPAYNRLTGEDTLGQEIHLRADYDIWTGFKVQGQVGWLIPSEGDTAAEYVLQLLYNF